MKIGTRVKIRKSYIKWLEKNLIETHSIPREGLKLTDSLIADIFLVKGLKYKAKVTGKGNENCIRVDIDFGVVKDYSFYEKKDLVKVRA
jgi:hypothetical protein